MLISVLTYDENGREMCGIEVIDAAGEVVDHVEIGAPAVCFAVAMLQKRYPRAAVKWLR